MTVEAGEVVWGVDVAVDGSLSFYALLSPSLGATTGVDCGASGLVVEEVPEPLV